MSYSTKNKEVRNLKILKFSCRKNFVSKITTRNYDAIIIGQTQFEKISLSKEFQVRKLREEINVITEAIDCQKQSNGDSWSFKDMKRMEEFSVRAERIRYGLVNPSNDNMLKLTHEAFIETDSSKVQACVQNVFDIYQETTNRRSTQMIFCDSGTPKKDHFNVYDEIKDQLMKKGVPKEKIAFIHDAKNEKQHELLFEKVRNGQVRVLLGSTNKVETETNVQNKLIAAHHLDCPWRPSDLTQRDGRIVRQGNENKEVSIHYYY